MSILDKKGVSIELIACQSQDDVIGIDDDIPWSFAQEFAFFKMKTIHQALLMGTRTARCTPLLKQRTTLVLSRDIPSMPDPYVCVQSVQEAIDWCVEHGRKRLMVCGGGEIYRLLLPHADVVLLNIINNLFLGKRAEALSQRVTHFPTAQIRLMIDNGDLVVREVDSFTDMNRKDGKDYQIFTYRLISREQYRSLVHVGNLD